MISAPAEPATPPPPQSIGHYDIHPWYTKWRVVRWQTAWGTSRHLLLGRGNGGCGFGGLHRPLDQEHGVLLSATTVRGRGGGGEGT